MNPQSVLLNFFPSVYNNIDNQGYLNNFNLDQKLSSVGWCLMFVVGRAHRDSHIFLLFPGPMTCFSVCLKMRVNGKSNYYRTS